jgi:hypothetical protein
MSVIARRTGLAFAVSFALLYWFPIRRWFARWGATSAEASRAMLGDSFIADPTDVATQAVTIDAPADAIWPWLVQIGYQRGGLYSYDWLDLLFGFLDRPSANTILPEYQHLAAGDEISLGPHQTLSVAAVEPQRALALSSSQHGMDWVWQLGLYPIDEDHTRLVSRGTERVHTVAAWLGVRVMEPAAFIMTRRMLLGVKQRAEGSSNRLPTAATGE